MKNEPFLNWIIIVILFLIIVSSCSTTPSDIPTIEPQATLILPTSTAIPPTHTPPPPTETPIPTSCDDVDGNCLELYFTGEDCYNQGPETFPAGSFTLIYFNQSDMAANVAILRHKKDKTAQDMIDYIGEEPSPLHHPMWSSEQGAWKKESDPVLSGETYTWQGLLVFGIHTTVCTRAEPHGAWLGSAFTVEE